MPRTNHPPHGPEGPKETFPGQKLSKKMERKTLGGLMTQNKTTFEKWKTNSYLTPGI